MRSSLRRFRSVRGRIVFIGVAAAVAAQLEAIALVLVVPLATSAVDGDQGAATLLGPLELDAEPGVLAVAVVVALLGALLSTVALHWARATAVAQWQNGARKDLVRVWLDADWATQSADRAGALPALVGFVQRGGSMLVRFADLLRSSLTLTIFLVTALVVSAPAALGLVLVGALLFGGLRPLVARVRRLSRDLANRVQRFNEDLTEVAALGREVKVFDAAGAVAHRMDDQGDQIERSMVRQTFLLGVTQPLYQYLGMLVGVGALVAVATLDVVAVEEVGAVALLVLRSLTYGQATQSAYQSLAEAAPYLDAAEEFGDRLRRAAQPDGTVEVATIDEVRFQGVGYTYPGQDVPALEAVELVLHRGEVVGLVGESGSGKSTLSQLLLRLRSPGVGDILVDGTPLPDLTLASWRDLVTLVPQDVPLFHGTVAENVAFFDPGIGHDAVGAALDAVGLGSFVAGLESGLDTPVGPATRNLSGGQIQRIGIARALVRRPRVLVLDEPTSALDVHSEAVIHDTLARLRGDLLVVVIAHRLSTLAICDRLVVLEGGRVAADGPHDEVYRSHPYFQRAVGDGLVDDLDPAAGP